MLILLQKQPFCFMPVVILILLWSVFGLHRLLHGEINALLPIGYLRKGRT